MLQFLNATPPGFASRLVRRIVKHRKFVMGKGKHMNPVSFWCAGKAGHVAAKLRSRYSAPYLGKRATGIPPSRCQTKLRIDAARRLLRETKESVITIASEVGYPNPSHLTQAFGKEAGLAPTDYRRQR